jgi:regulator of RNase E activity RraA
MTKTSFSIAGAALAVTLICGLQIAGSQAGAAAQQAPSAAMTADDPLIAAYSKATIASVADAVDQIVGERGFMSHDMQPRVPGRFAGRAVTALLRQAPPEKATAQLSAKHSVEMIDTAPAGAVGIIVVEDGLDVAGMGGLMATAAKARGMVGVVLDGGLRDVAEVRALGLPAYARSIVPSSSVGRWASVGNNMPVKCAGVMVKPGDIIVAGEDGVVRVPAEKAEEVLKRSKEIDERETKMVPFIMKERSLTKAIQVFNRI